MADQLLTLKEACGRLQIGDDTLRKWRRAGLIKVVRTSTNLVRIAASEIDRFIAAQTTDETTNEDDWDGN